MGSPCDPSEYPMRVPEVVSCACACFRRFFWLSDFLSADLSDDLQHSMAIRPSLSTVSILEQVKRTPHEKMRRPAGMRNPTRNSQRVFRGSYLTPPRKRVTLECRFDKVFGANTGRGVSKYQKTQKNRNKFWRFVTEYATYLFHWKTCLNALSFELKNLFHHLKWPCDILIVVWLVPLNDELWVSRWVKAWKPWWASRVSTVVGRQVVEVFALPGQSVDAPLVVDH